MTNEEWIEGLLKFALALALFGVFVGAFNPK